MSHEFASFESVALVALVGPTAVGKSALAILLAERLPLEIVNADSRQVYRYMDIGTGKPTDEERARVPHHVFDVADPDDAFSLADYRRHAASAMDLVRARGNIPLLVGGSGQYVWSVVEGWHVPNVPPDPAFRQEMERYAALQGHSELHARLTRIDPEAGERIQATNVRRVIRALELHRGTGMLPSRILWRRERVSTAGTLVLGLSLDSAELFARVDARIDTMVRCGFADEVRALLDRGYSPSLPSMSSIGYREMADCVGGASDLQAAVARIRRETRRLVRRQRAWFRAADERIIWLDTREPLSALDRSAMLLERALR